MQDYIHNVAYITAYRDDRDAVTNSHQMGKLKEDLQRAGYTPRRCASLWNGKLREVYAVGVVPGRVELRELLKISRKYGQRTLIFFGRLYEVSTGRVLRRFTRATFYTYRPEVPSWIKITRPFYPTFFLELS